MRRNEEEQDVYIIPQNFIEGGKVFGGMFRWRNVVEAAILGLATGFPLFHLPIRLYYRIILLCLIPLPLTLFGLIGIGDDSLSEFVLNFFGWLRRRRIIGNAPEELLDKRRWWEPGFVRKALDRLRTKLPAKEVRADEEDFEIVFYDSETEVPENAARWDEFQNRPLSPAATDQKKPRKRVKRKLEDAKVLKDYLPIERIENGIVITKDGRYIKILEVEPLNFLLRGPREQRGIVYSFASLLKISPVKLQFKVISKKADVGQHLEKLRECMQQEPEPRCRELQKDYYSLIRRLGSREAVTRRFFLIFEYENDYANRRPDYREVLSVLETTARNARSFLLQCGNHIVEHDNEDEFISEVFYILFNRKTSAQVPLGERVAEVLGRYIMSDEPTKLEEVDVNELVAPPSIDFTHSRYILMDGLYHSYLIIPADAYKVQVVAGWLSLIVNAGEGIDVDLFFHKEPKERVQQKIGQQIRINRSKIKDTSDTNTDFDDLEGAIQSGYFLKRGIANNEDFYYLSIIITITADSVKNLDWRVKEMRKLLISQDMDARVCGFLQEDALLSVLPIAGIGKKLYRKTKRNVLTTGAASCYPFTSFEMSDDNGILMGVNKYNNSLVVVDIFNSRLYKNANMAILGTSGAGKTFTMQLMALRLRQHGIQVFILAPLKGHEFRRACQNIGGEFIQISPASKNCINIMEIRKVDTSANDLLDGPQGDRSELAAKIQKLHIFFSLLIPDMSYEEKQLLDEAIVRTYNRFGITHDNDSLEDPERPGSYRQMPILGNLYALLRESPETRRLANILNRLVNGSASTFNQPTNVSLDNKYTVIDISELSGDLLSVGMFSGLDYIFDTVKADRTTRKMIFIPEMWKLIGSGSNRDVANYVLEIFKIIRGYGGGAVADTQDLSDFLALEDGKYGRGILNVCKTKIILNMEDDEARRVQETLHLTDTEIMNITHFQRGSGLISTNNNNVTVEFRCSELEKELITTDREELGKILQRKAQARIQALRF
ncbi:hypothetical protein C814_02585 [Anaerotruncus sp. G3(2012)]|uniref:VirB4 family type IV secretion system protein n=1 Tax=Anaerotruncus sp. G3(2012) TaxID=1235835 RepID=UPI00033AE54A|nr:hypothetical protein [Anaerotruncus sp. G3(2012)]EOS56996.1 hypothetical protein C814_02585 [Anaerotruncus sp. G3(2012)]